MTNQFEQFREQCAKTIELFDDATMRESNYMLDAHDCADIIRALPLPVMPEQAEPVKEKRAPVQGYAGGIPWDMHLRAYDVYCKRWSPQKALIEGGCRGGFSTGELDMFIPGWRDELSERTDLLARIAELEAENQNLKELSATDYRTIRNWLISLPEPVKAATLGKVES